MKVGKYASAFLKAADVKAPVTVTVAAVEEETFRGEKGEETKLAIFFKEIEQGVILNKCNIEALVSIFGTEESDDWIGKTVVLYQDPNITFKGVRKGGLRFRSV